MITELLIFAYNKQSLKKIMESDFSDDVSSRVVYQ